ncbi:MAG: YggS family pyridoxal phosphate-dependent enzyme [bacterium]|nr:YggS family pyridoxal phosphate-dependent enzyme [bacterium]
MASIKENVERFRSQLGSVQLMVVTKHRSAQQIRQVIDAGVQCIGENRLQEIEDKYDLKLFRELKQKGGELHFIGHLQTNKTAKVVRFSDCIQSVDSLRLAEEIERQAAKLGKTMPIFLELNLTGEEQKHGLSEADLASSVEAIRTLQHLQLRGLMCMGKDDDLEATRSAFRRCRQLAEQFQLPEVSMGMSGDYQVALQEGSTMIRVGSAIF